MSPAKGGEIRGCGGGGAVVEERGRSTAKGGKRKWFGGGI